MVATGDAHDLLCLILLDCIAVRSICICKTALSVYIVIGTHSHKNPDARHGQLVV